MTTKPRVKIIVLGGTITMASKDHLAVKPTLQAERLVDLVPELSEVVDVEPQTLMMKPSASLNWEDMRLLYHAIRQAFSEGCHGVVVLQGTDTLEEVAFILDLLCDHAWPIVVSGSMRPTFKPGYDGPANILAAVKVVVCQEVVGLGTLVVMNNTVHAARFVIKSHTEAPDAFVSRLAGPIGLVHEDKLQLLYHIRRKLPSFSLPDAPLPRVGLFAFAFGQSWPFEAMSQYDAIILEAAGSGHVAGEDVAPLARLAKKMPVVFTSRTRNGIVMKETYGYPGSEIDLIEAGLIPAGQYDSAKARILTILALWNHHPVDANLFLPF